MGAWGKQYTLKPFLLEQPVVYGKRNRFGNSGNSQFFKKHAAVKFYRIGSNKNLLGNIISAEEAYKIQGAAFEVYKEIERGFTQG